MVMNAFKEPGLWLLALLMFSGRSKQTPGGFQLQVKCIVFNEEYLTCSWGSEEKLAANYTLYYWFEGREQGVKDCPEYLQRDSINVGCRFNLSSEDDLFSTFHIYVNTSHSRTVFGDSMLLVERVQPGPPFNLSIQSLANNQLLLSWNSTYKTPRCLEHEVKYRSHKDAAWTEQKTTGMEFSVASVDPDKFYTFYVRSKIRIACGNTDLWSDRAGPVYWGKETVPSVDAWVQILLGMCAVCLLIVLLVALICMERVRLVLLPAIPNPSKKFEDLFTAYHGNFSEWAGVSKDAVESFKPNYRESICHVSELFPGGGYLPVSTDVTVKAGGVPGLLANPIPQTNIP